MQMINSGKLEVKIDNELIKSLDIFAKNEIRRKEVFDYFKELLLNLNSIFK